MADNASPGTAKTAKNDEFYRRPDGIEIEVISDERVFEPLSNTVFSEDNFFRSVEE